MQRSGHCPGFGEKSGNDSRDEPTGALDFQTSIQVLQLLADPAGFTGKTVVIITHNTAIAPIAQRIFHLKDGGSTKLKLTVIPFLRGGTLRVGENNWDLNDNREPVPLAW